MSSPGLSCGILIFFFFYLTLCCLFFKSATAVFGQSVQFLVCLDTTAHRRVRVWGASFPLLRTKMCSGCLHSLWSVRLAGCGLGNRMPGKALGSICRITREKEIVLGF